MTTTPEAKTKAKITAFLKKVPLCWYFMPIGGAYSQKGIPDIVGHVNGWSFAIEVKAPGKLANVTALQERALKAIADTGGVAMLVDNVEDVMATFNEKGWV
jgi:hypothetical protein